MNGVSELRFDPPPLCERDDCCDLSCVWPSGEPLLWEGDNT